MTSHENGFPVGRRSVLSGLAGLAGAAMLPSGAASGAPAPGLESVDPAWGRRYPAPWPELAPYGLADTRTDLWPREDNSFVLPLELRPRDEELGRVWMRDTYVNCFVVDGRPLYVATGTTRVPGLPAAGPWNDGIFVWLAPSLHGPWRLADTSGIRPDAEKGKVWSSEFVGENRAGRTVVAPWQEFWYDDQFGKRGQVWAPELHYFRGTWYIVACMGDHSRKVGSFLLISEGGVEGPYRLAEGNVEKPFGDSFIGGPKFIEPGAYHHIDGSLYTEGDDAWLVLHNDLYARFRDDLEDIVPTTALPKFQQSPYSPEPYLEGSYVFKHGGKYYLLHAAWDRASTNADGTTRNAYDPPGPGRVQYQYDAVLAVSDHFEGPYSKRWTAGVGAGHNNLFEDASGQLWATFFRNPAFGYWADPARIGEAAVPGVVRLEWTGPASNRIYVQRRGRRMQPLPALGALGANFNENLDQLNYGELNSAHATWIRGFYAVNEADDVPPEQSAGLRVIREAHERGFRTILSLKFPKTDVAFPRPGSAEMTAELGRLDRILPLVLGTADIVTIGNEPFIESMPSQRDQRLNEFYETVARHVIAARANNSPAPYSTHLYMGALNRLDLPEQRTPAVERYLAFARRTPAIEGVDLHPHVRDEARIQDFLDYTLPRLRPDQTFLVTEFSIVWHWQQHLTDRIPAAFARHYGYSPDVQVWQVIGEAIKQPFPAQKWNDLLSQSPWFESRKHLLRDEMARFRSTGRLAVATYGFRQIPSMTANWSATKTPWLLNSVFAPLTVRPRADGTATPGYAWINDFRSLQ